MLVLFNARRVFSTIFFCVRISQHVWKLFLPYVIFNADSETIRSICKYDESYRECDFVAIDLDCTERTPLLLTAPKKIIRTPNVSVFVLGFIVIAGVIIGSYLLVQQDKSPVVTHGFDLVEREIWNKYSPSYDIELLNSSMVLYIIIMQTDGEECWDSFSCIEILEQMRDLSIKNGYSDIPLNFAIGGDGKIYEIRGWEFESGFNFIPKKTSLTVGFIGNFTVKSPTEEQFNEAEGFLESLKWHKVQQSYKVYGIRRIGISESHMLYGDGLFLKVSKWKNFDMLLDIL